MTPYALVRQEELHFYQEQTAIPFDFTPEELNYMADRTMNDALYALLPPGDGTVHAAPFAPREARVDLALLLVKLQTLIEFLTPKNQPS